MADDGVRVASGIEGIPDGTRLEFNYWTTNATQRQQASQILVQGLMRCGVKANLQFWVPGEFFADGPDGPTFGRYFDISQFAWVTGIEPPCDLFTSGEIPGPPEDGFCGWGCANVSGWSSSYFDEICNAALSTLPGQPAHEEYHLLAQEIFTEQLPTLPLYLRMKVAATRPDMCGFIMDPTAYSEMWNIENFELVR